MIIVRRSICSTANHYKSVSKPKMTTKVAVVQMCSKTDTSVNFAVCEHFVQQAAAAKAKMVFLPEAVDYIAPDTETSKAMAHTSQSSFIRNIRRIAKQHCMWISIGGWHEHVPKDMERMRNTHTIINDKGDIVANYHKVHMFDVNIEGRLSLMESKYTAPGNHIRPPVATPAGALGLGTVCVLAHVDHQNNIQCYDMRFSAHGARLRELGADILTFPSAFTKPTGEAGHWHTLLRARAIETQCYVIAAAQFGLIVDPWGVVLVDLGEQQQAIGFADIDLKRLKDVRANMPVMEHRREDVYASLHLLPPPTVDEVLRFADKPIPGDTVFALTKHSYAFVNILPVLPGHVLVSSRRNTAQKLSQLRADEMTDLFLLVQRVQAMIERYFATDSSTVVVQDGAAAGRTVEVGEFDAGAHTPRVQHVHVHVIPRKTSDYADPDEFYNAVGRPLNVSMNCLQLQSNDKSVANATAKHLRSRPDMAAEATVYQRLMYDS